MLIKDIRLKNFRTHNNSFVEFTPGINHIWGPNGAGKSSIVEAIGVLFFNYYQGTLKDMVSFGENVSTLEGNFLLEKEYRVLRMFGETSLYEVYEDDVLVASGRDASVEFLTKLYGVSDIKALWGAICMQQNRLHEVSTVLYDLISRAFGLSKYESIWRAMREPVSDLTKEANRLQLELEVWKDRQSQLQTVKRDIAELEAVPFEDVSSMRSKWQEDLYQNCLGLLKTTEHLEEHLEQYTRDTLFRPVAINNRNMAEDYLFVLEKNKKCPVCFSDIQEGHPAIIEYRKRLEEEIPDDHKEYFAMMKKREEAKTVISTLPSEEFSEERQRRAEAYNDAQSRLSLLRSMAVETEKPNVDDTENALQEMVEIREIIRQIGPAIAKALKEVISHRASNIFSSLLPYESSLRLDDDFRIVANINDASLPFTSLSGGQQTAVCFAIQQALAENTTVGIMVMDETAANLDAAVKQTLFNSLVGPQIIVITHDTTIEYPDNSIEVRLNGEVL